MSWQATRAVNHNSKITNMKLFRLLLYLADYADESGRIDPAPNQDTMAEFYDTTTRTIRNWINKLCESGELVQVRVGSGPGNPSAYQITLEFPEENTSKGGRKAEVIRGPSSAFEDFKEEIKAEILTLKAEINDLKAEKTDGKGGKGGKERRKDHSFKSADDPYVDPILIHDHNNNNDYDITREEDFAVNYFSGASGIPNPDYSSTDFFDNWLTPMRAIVKKCATHTEIEDRIDYSLRQMYGESGKVYTVKSPKSILTFAMNYGHKPKPSPNGHSNGNGNGQRKETAAERVARLFPDEVSK